MPREGSLLSGKRWAVIFFMALFGTASIMMLCREVFIPMSATGALRGLVGHDQTYYHSLAVVLAQEIKEKGWVAWTLRPNGQAPAAILGALYVFFGPDSRVVILINALLHTVGTMALYGIVMRYVSWKVALFLCTPFWFSPYQMMSLYSQPNKDSYAWAGALILIYGWMELARHFQKAMPSMSKIWFRALFLVYAGATLMILVRPYLVTFVVLYGAGVLCWLLIQSVRVYRADGARGSRDQTVKLVSVLILLLAILPLSKSDVENETLERRLKYMKSLTATAAWHRTAWLPESIDNKIAAIMIVHRGSFHDFLNDQMSDGEVVTTNASEALIDLDHRFEDVADVIAYLPRAIQIGIFAPFPERWALLKPSGSALWSFSTWYPRPPVKGLRMFMAYISYGFLLWGIIHFRNKQDLALILCFSLTFILYYAFAIPHVGALDRYRSPFFCLLVTMGFTCAARCWTDRKAGVFHSASTSPDVSVTASKG
ncbi:MAG: hypothetical protein AABY47_07100 [Pseudomonadota bacterium]